MTRRVNHKQRDYFGNPQGELISVNYNFTEGDSIEQLTCRRVFVCIPFRAPEYCAAWEMYLDAPPVTGREEAKLLGHREPDPASRGDLTLPPINFCHEYPGWFLESNDPLEVGL